MPMLTSTASPFVARLGERNEVRLVERSGDLICESTRSVVFLTLILSFCWGSFLTYLVWGSIRGPAANSPGSVHTPLFAVCIMGLFALLSWSGFVRALLGAPRFEVSGATGEISFFRWRAGAPSKRTPASEISHFMIEKHFYAYRQRETENAVLMLFTTTGERQALCASPDLALIDSLAHRLELLTGKQMTEAAASSGVSSQENSD